jgi:rfaE bifunctional protein kinase chain/domain
MSYLNNLFHEFTTKRILVVGDVMIDSYLRGRVNRVSPEAPVPIVSLDKEEDRLGGAANVALNLVALGAKPVICSVIGTDKQAKRFHELSEQAGISSEGLVSSSDRSTTVKTRVIGNNQQLLRIDSEQVDLISMEEEHQLIAKAEELMNGKIDAVIFEDYNKGVLTPNVISSIISLATKKNIPTAVDPKKEHFFEYKGVTLFKPNLKELREGLNKSFHFHPSDKHAFEAAVSELETRLENKISFVTLSEHGVYIREGENRHYAEAHPRTIADVSGAGDTVIAVATLCLACGVRVPEIAEIANIAGGLVCEFSGVIPIDKEQFMSEARRLMKLK